MAHSVCPWWIGYLLLSPLRRWGQNPRRILDPLLKPGMTALDLGCAMGFFTLEAARLVGESGRVVAVDVQPRMVRTLDRRARRAGLDHLIESRSCTESDLGLADLAGRVDFALAFAVVHEVPDQTGFMGQIAAALRPDGRALVAEPKGHVSEDEFEVSLAAAGAAGLEVVERPPIARSHSVLLRRPRS